MLAWLFRNWAETGQDPGLAPLHLQLTLEQALPRIREALARLPRWQMVAWDEQTGIITATRTTRLFRFVDDVTIRLEATPQGTTVHTRSKSRLGKGDLGQNRRNILELFQALQERGKGS